MKLSVLSAASVGSLGIIGGREEVAPTGVILELFEEAAKRALSALCRLRELLFLLRVSVSLW